MSRLPYFGGKEEKNLAYTALLCPEEQIDTFVDCCFGSGNVTRTIPCEMLGVKKVGIELDRGMFALHSQIKEDVYALIEKIKPMNNSQDTYLSNKRKLEEYVEGSEKYSRIEIAAAELFVLAFSYNSMRSRWRNADFYKKHTSDEERDKAKKTAEAFHNRFYEKIPITLLDLSLAWQELNLINGNFFDYTHYWDQEGTLCYLDLPYELKKRGIFNQNTKKNAGYMKDLTQNDHEKFISEVCSRAAAGRLHGWLMICTNYEIDETGKLIIEADDLYTELLKYGFRMVVTEKKESSEIIRKNSRHDSKKRRKKAEVVFINYLNIRGSWDNYEWYDYRKLLGKK